MPTRSKSLRLHVILCNTTVANKTFSLELASMNCKLIRLHTLTELTRERPKPSPKQTIFRTNLSLDRGRLFEAHVLQGPSHNLRETVGEAEDRRRKLVSADDRDDVVTPELVDVALVDVRRRRRVVEVLLEVLHRGSGAAGTAR